MPDFWTHILGGELILKDLDNIDIKEKIIKNRRLFYFGCQGPDFFYYNDFWPWIKDKRGPEVGREIHEHDFRSFFSCSMDFIQLEKNDRLKVYFYGVLCHYVLDKYLHSFINKLVVNDWEHKRVEQKLDIFLVDKLWREKAYRLPPVEAINIGESLPVEIDEYYRYLLSTLFDYSPEIDFIEDSYQDMKKVLSIFYCPERYKCQVLKILNKLLPLDISIYIYPEKVDVNFFGEKEKKEIYSLLNRARREGAGLIKLVNSKVQRDFIEFLPEVSFLGREVN